MSRSVRLVIRGVRRRWPPAFIPRLVEADPAGEVTRFGQSDAASHAALAEPRRVSRRAGSRVAPNPTQNATGKDPHLTSPALAVGTRPAPDAEFRENLRLP